MDKVKKKTVQQEEISQTVYLFAVIYYAITKNRVLETSIKVGKQSWHIVW